MLEPGSTDTEFQEVAGEIGHDGEPPRDVVRVALEALGRQPSVVSGWWNWLRSNLATRLAPRSFVVHLARDVIEEIRILSEESDYYSTVNDVMTGTA